MFIFEQTTEASGSVRGFDVVVLVLGLLAFAFAMWQLLKTNGAAKTAIAALDFTRHSMIRTQVITVMTDLKGILGGIDAAYAAKNMASLDSELNRFSFRAHEAVLLLAAVDEKTAELEALLGNIALNASMARSRLSTTDDKYLNDSINELRIIVPKVHALGLSMSLNPMTPTKKNERKKKNTQPERSESAEKTVNRLLGTEAEGLGDEGVEADNTPDSALKLSTEPEKERK